MFYGRENANYIRANRYPVAAAQNLPDSRLMDEDRVNSGEVDCRVSNGHSL